MSLSDANEIVDSTMSSRAALGSENETFLIEYAPVFVRRTLNILSYFFLAPARARIPAAWLR